MNEEVLPNIAKIPRTHASDAMNCFPRFLIDTGNSEQACLQDIIVHLFLLMRISDVKLVKFKQDLKQNQVILT